MESSKHDKPKDKVVLANDTVIADFTPEAIVEASTSPSMKTQSWCQWKRPRRCMTKIPPSVKIK